MGAVVFQDADVQQLEARGMTVEEARRQLDLLLGPARHARLVRPCTLGDGIDTVPESAQPELLALHAEAARAGRLSKFVPASGAGSRMFEPLLYFVLGEGRGLSRADVERRAAQGDGRASALLTFLARVRSFPACPDLEELLTRRGQDLDALGAAGEIRPILEALVGPGGLALDTLPKGLLAFHVEGATARTAFEEHLVDAAAYVRDGGGVCRLHFTVLPEHRAAFADLLGRVREPLGRRLGASFAVGWSVQKPFTDTLALDADDRPLRDGDGRLRFWPGGHGALIENLNDLEGDLVHIRNIDNVQPDRLKPTAIHWKKVLAGYLVQWQREVSNDRPLRVCGVVRNTGEPGGGPFWVRGPDGTVTRQIVEAAEVDPADAEQQAILRAATHFNPVDLVCAVRDADGRPHDLTAFVDPGAVILARKSESGRPIRVLERPGLWNGGMAGWNTAFVEVPLQTFSPVKTVLDLLRQEHMGTDLFSSGK